MDVYDCIRHNRGLFAYHLNRDAMLHDCASFPPQLQTAICQACEECVSTAVVDVLLKSDIATINNFIDKLKKNQPELCKYFTTYCNNGNRAIEWYQHVDVGNGEPLPLHIQHYLRLIFKSLCEAIHITEYIIIKLLNQRIISRNDYNRLHRLRNDSKKRTEFLINIIINGSLRQYLAFKFIVKHYQCISNPYF